MATMQTCGGRISGQALMPPMVPMLERQTVPPVSYDAVSLEDEARLRRC